MDGTKLTKEEILIIADGLEGMSFKKVKRDIKSENKGAQGLAIENEAFGILANSRKESDFKLAGIELKVTPIKKNKNGTISSKERLVLNIINYMQEDWEDFYNSSLWKKNELILILFYLFEPDVKKNDMRIIKSFLFDINEQDLATIKKDWEIIAHKVKKGLAHELSEADTMYLGACTKGKNSKSLRIQPYSKILAKQRAYSFKNSYMTQFVRQIIGNSTDVEQIICDKSSNHLTVEEYVYRVVSKYINMTREALCEKFNINSEAKNLNSMIISRMFGLKGKISKSKEFLKGNVVVKTIRVEKTGSIKESMSFPYFKYTEIINEKWHSSQLRNYFDSTKFLFVVFKHDGTDYVFKGVKFWNMPISVLDNEVKQVWSKTVNIIKTGDIINKIEANKTFTNFPGSVDNSVMHVRPHGTTKNDVAKLPVKDKKTGNEFHTKHCFWLNNSFIKEIIIDML